MIIDPITLEVLRNKLEFITEEMENCLIKSAYCVQVKEGADATTGIFDAKGELIGQCVGNPMHFGEMLPAVASIIERFSPDTMVDGDVFINNDPYAGGTHLPCVFVVMPVLYRGELVAFTCSVLHHLDIGGKTPGSMVADATEIYQEGIIIPPMKLYEQERLNEPLVNLLKNNVRTSDSFVGDLMAEVAACHIGRQRFLEVLDQYGKDTVITYLGELLDRTEALTREGIGAIPDGEYTFTDYMDNDGIELDKLFNVAVKLRVEGSEVEVNFENSSAQTRGPTNLMPSDALTCVAYVMRLMVDPSLANNSGYYRPIKLVLPEGSVVNPRRPAPLSLRSHTMHRIVDALMGALVKALLGKMPAASGGAIQAWNLGGLDPVTGKPWVYMEVNWPGSGARPSKDGIDCIAIHFGITKNNPVEATEAEFPLRVMRYRYRQDSGGAGEYRGGLGIERVVQLTRGEAFGSSRSERHYTSPWGLYGGLPGARWGVKVVQSSGEIVDSPSKSSIYMRAGDELHVLTGGGGGYGDPLDRDPEHVLLDALDGKVSVEAASELHGVVVDEEEMAVDLALSSRLRQEMKDKRGPIWWTFDRGPGLGKE